MIAYAADTTKVTTHQILLAFGYHDIYPLTQSPTANGSIFLSFKQCYFVGGSGIYEIVERWDDLLTWAWRGGTIGPPSAVHTIAFLLAQGSGHVRCLRKLGGAVG
jgi:hypothetical protein